MILGLILVVLAIGEQHREVASNLHELTRQCHVPVARRELLGLAERYEPRE
jgi:hypothetical protein